MVPRRLEPHNLLAVELKRLVHRLPLLGLFEVLGEGDEVAASVGNGLGAEDAFELRLREAGPRRNPAHAAAWRGRRYWVRLIANPMKVRHPVAKMPGMQPVM